MKAPMGQRCATSTHSQQEDLNLGHLTAGRAVQTLARQLLFSVPWLPAPSPLQGCLPWGTFQRTVLLPDPPTSLPSESSLALLQGIYHITLCLDPLREHFSLGPLSTGSAPYAHCP